MVLTAIASIQIGSALAAQLFETIGALGTVAWRLSFAALFLIAATRPRLPKDWRAALPSILTFGAVIGTMNALFYMAVERVPLGIVVTIEFLGPLGVAAWRSTRWLDRTWVALALIGVALLAPIGASALDPVGLLLAALAGAAWAGFVLLSAPIAKRMPGNSGLTFGMGIAALLTLPFGIAPAAIVFTDPLTLGTLIAVALLSTAIPFARVPGTQAHVGNDLRDTHCPGARRGRPRGRMDSRRVPDLAELCGPAVRQHRCLGQALTAKQTPS